MTVSRYWQVFKLKHQSSVLTAAALHIQKGKYTQPEQKLNSVGSGFTHTITGDNVSWGEVKVTGELIRARCQALLGLVGRP